MWLSHVSRGLLACSVLALIGLDGDARAQVVGVVLRPVAVSGDPVPGGDGSFNFVQLPSINDAGEISFSATFTGTVNIAGVLVERSSGLEVVARSNDPAPDGNGVLFSFGLAPVPINGNGRVAFSSGLFNASAGSSPRIFTADGQTLRQVVSLGQASPDGNGTFASFKSIGIEDGGDVTFWALFNGTSGGAFVDDRGVYRGDGVAGMGPAPLEEILRAGEGVGGGTLTVGNIDDHLASDESGWVAIRTFLNSTPIPGTDDLTVFVDDGGVRSRRFTIGDASPDGNGTIFSFPIPFIANDGKLATHVTFTNSAQGLSDNMGIVSYDPLLPINDQVLVREGDDAPGQMGVTFTVDFTDAMGFASTLTAPNRFVFHGFLNGAQAGTGTGLFLARDGVLFEVVREGDATPGGDGDFDLLRLNQAHVNPAGTVVFFAQVRNQTTLGDGIFRWSQSAGLSRIARVGQPLLGSTIQAIFFMTDAEARLAGNQPMNAFGEITFRVRLEDGREAIIATPEPQAGLLGLMAIAALAASCRRRLRIPAAETI